MKQQKIFTSYFLIISPLAFMASIFNELRFSLTVSSIADFSWMHLFQAFCIFSTGYIFLLIPSFSFLRRLEASITSDNLLSDEFKAISFAKSMRAIAILTVIALFIMIMLPQITGLFFIDVNSTYAFFSRFVFDFLASAALWIAVSFLTLTFFSMKLERITEVSSIKKIYLQKRKRISFGSIIFLGILQGLLLTATTFLSIGSFFAEMIVTNPGAEDLKSLLITAAVSAVFLLIVINLYFRVFQNLQDRKIGRIIKMLDSISTENRVNETVEILNFDEFDDLSENFCQILKNVQSGAFDFKSRTEQLQNSLKETRVILEKTDSPLSKISNLSFEAFEANAQIFSLAQSDKTVHHLTDIVSRMEKQIHSQEYSIDQTSSAIEQMSSSIAAIIQTIQTASQLADKLKNYSETGSRAIKEARLAIDEIKDASQSVSEILAVIQRIAAQTNLLSMNASIEAAHAGKSGTGFALVAQSVRTLADESTKSSKKIENYISEMDEQIQIAIQTIVSTTKIFSSIQKNINENTELIETIFNAMNEEESATQDTATAIASVIAVGQGIKTQFQTQKEAAINVEETVTLIIDIADRMRQLLAAESEMTKNLQSTTNVIKGNLSQSKQTLIEIEDAFNVSVS